MENLIQIAEKRIEKLKKLNYKKFSIYQILTIIGTTVLTTLMSFADWKISGMENFKLLFYALPIVGILWIILYLERQGILEKDQSDNLTIPNINPIAEILLVKMQPDQVLGQNTAYIMAVLLQMLEGKMFEIEVSEKFNEIEEFDLHKQNKQLIIKFQKETTLTIENQIDRTDIVFPNNQKKTVLSTVVPLHLTTFFMNIQKILVREVINLSTQGLCKRPLKMEELSNQYLIASPKQKAFKTRTLILNEILNFIKKGNHNLSDENMIIKIFQYGIILNLENEFYKYLYENSSRKDFVTQIGELYKAIYWNQYVLERINETQS